MRFPFFFAGLSLLAACSSSGTSATDATDPSPTTPAPSASTTEPAPTDTKPSVCASPPSGKASVVGAVGPIQVPAAITGTTKEGIDFIRYPFTLDHVVKIRVKAEINDFADTTEKTGVGFSVSFLTSGGSEDGRASAHVDPSGHADEATTTWLLPGRYELLVSRATYASANANAPILPHAYSVSLETIEPPKLDGTCTFPDDARSPTDVRVFPECSAWCKKVSDCGMDCRDEECAIPAGQCEASIRKKLACELAAGFTCVSQGGGHGYSIDADCKPDPSLCKP